MQFGAGLGQRTVADAAQHIQPRAHVGKEAVEFALYAAPAKPAQTSHQLGQGELARAGEGTGMVAVARQGCKSRALKLFGQIGQNTLDGIMTLAQHARQHRVTLPQNQCPAGSDRLSSVDWLRSDRDLLWATDLFRHKTQFSAKFISSSPAQLYGKRSFARKLSSLCCRRQFKIDHLCQLNFDQGSNAGCVVPGCG